MSSAVFLRYLLSQVKVKSEAIVSFLRKDCQSDVQRSFACLTLANSLVSQCEGQVSKINSFAFPLAFVCVKVGAEVPLFMEVLLGKLMEVREGGGAGGKTDRRERWGLAGSRDQEGSLLSLPMPCILRNQLI